MDITTITNDEALKSRCKSICNGRYIWEDLWHDFILTMAEKPQHVIEVLIHDNKLRNYSFIVIANLYKKRGNRKSNLHEVTSENEIFDFADIIDNFDKENEMLAEIKLLPLEDSKRLLIFATSSLKAHCKENDKVYQNEIHRNNKVKLKLKQVVNEKIRS